ncbi:Na(+)/H(+) antiporter subunit A [archaeon HR06]|nr:Na(+)/H(+) antiporter subunit A [archaeon HR06]
MDKLGGLAKNLPITAIASMVGFLTLMGVPPTLGFQAEWLLFLGAFQVPLQTNDYFRLLLAYLALTSTILTTAYSLNTMRKIFFGPRPQELKEIKEAPLVITIPLLIITLLTIIFGIYPNLFTEKLLPLTYSRVRG